MSSVWSSLTSLFTWVSRTGIPVGTPTDIPTKLEIDTISADPAVLAEGWYWIISNAEKVISSQQEEIISEIRSLHRISGTVKYRPYLSEKVISIWSRLESEKLLELTSSRLDASLRSALLRDFINRRSRVWAGLIRQILYSRLRTVELIQSSSDLKERIENIRSTLDSQWNEDRYSKNILGNLRDSALQASSASQNVGLTIRILVDILWTMATGLSRVLIDFTSLTSRPIHLTESYLILDSVLDGVRDLIELWVKTSQQTKTITQRIGKLPAKWKDNILIKPEVNFRYLDPKAPPDRITKDNFQRASNQLERLFQRRKGSRIRDRRESQDISIPRERFREVSVLLETFFRKR